MDYSLSDVEIQPILEWDEDEVAPACVVKYPRLRDGRSGGLLLDLADGSWSMLEGEVTDGRAVLELSHRRSWARFTVTMDPSGHFSIDGSEERLLGTEVPRALARKNIEPLIARARALLAHRPLVPEETVRALDTRTPAAKAFYPRIGKDGAREVDDGQLYWILHAYDEALAAEASLNTS